jgi:D-sedoheptulose 7-phosphate isomerase
MKQYLEQLSRVTTTMLGDIVLDENFAKAVDIFKNAIPNRKKIFVAGNGGSAGEAQRFALAFVTKFQKEHEAYPALSLASDPSLLTAIGNDYGFAEEFKRQIEAFGEEGDIFVALSVSGNSENVIRAVKEARARGLKTISLLGKDGGKMKGMCDADIIIPSINGADIQTMHLFIMHALCAELESSF